MNISWPTVDHLEWVTLAGGCLLGTWRYGIQPARRKVQSIRASWAQAAASLARVERELQPNGGSSLRDSVDQIALGLRTVKSEARVMRAMQRAIASSPSNSALFETDPKGECVWASSAWVTLTGEPAEASMGWGWMNAIHQDEREAVTNEWNLAAEQHRAVNGTFRVCRAQCAPSREICAPQDQNLRGCSTVRYTATPVFGDQNEVLGYVVVAVPM